jgi:hypothetical protein
MFAAGLFRLANPLGSLESIHLGHLPIYQHNVERPLLQDL